MSVNLGLGPKLAFEVERNRRIGTSPTMPALHRYTGVLYDALDTLTLPHAAFSCASADLVIHSALFGLLRATDPIPAYRLSHDSKLPGLRLATLWSASISQELDAVDGLVVDMRSEAYMKLGPLPPAQHRAVLRVVTDAGNGVRRALNHFNKKGKGEFARAVLDSGIRHADVDSLIDWAATVGIKLERGAHSDLVLVVDEVVSPRSRDIS